MKSTTFPLAVACLYVTLFSGQASILHAEDRKDKTAPASSDIAELVVRFAWRNLPKTETTCEDFDYFPDGGMRNYACHLFDLIPYADFQRLVGIPIFVKGPHTQAALNLNAENSFGYYNREFVQRISRLLVPAVSDPAFREKTQKVYDEYAKNLARICYVTYRKWKENPEALKKEKSAFIDHIVHRDLPAGDYERFYYFMTSGFFAKQSTASDGEDERLDPDVFNDEAPDDDGMWDGNVVKTAAAFWIRRFTDGTAEDFYGGLVNLLNAYDRDFIREYR